MCWRGRTGSSDDSCQWSVIRCRRQHGSETNERKNLYLVLTTVLLTTAPPTEAQQPKKVHRIGYLSVFDLARESTRAEAIRLGLRELGYIEGQNIESRQRKLK
jgi:hypothetical protein